jgi:hypothetical protein
MSYLSCHGNSSIFGKKGQMLQIVFLNPPLDVVNLLISVSWASEKLSNDESRNVKNELINTKRYLE